MEFNSSNIPNGSIVSDILSETNSSSNEKSKDLSSLSNVTQTNGKINILNQKNSSSSVSLMCLEDYFINERQNTDKYNSFNLIGNIHSRQQLTSEPLISQILIPLTKLISDTKMSDLGSIIIDDSIRHSLNILFSVSLNFVSRTSLNFDIESMAYPYDNNNVARAYDALYKLEYINIQDKLKYNIFSYSINWEIHYNYLSKYKEHIKGFDKYEQRIFLLTSEYNKISSNLSSDKTLGPIFEPNSISYINKPDQKFSNQAINNALSMYKVLFYNMGSEISAASRLIKFNNTLSINKFTPSMVFKVIYLILDGILIESRIKVILKIIRDAEIIEDDAKILHTISSISSSPSIASTESRKQTSSTSSQNPPASTSTIASTASTASISSQKPPASQKPLPLVISTSIKSQIPYSRQSKVLKVGFKNRKIQQPNDYEGIP